jgi:serine/threonine-protein kinase
MAALGQLLFDKGELAEADQMLRPALAIQRKIYSQGHFSLATSCVALGNVLVAHGNAREAEGLLREGLEFRQSKLKSGHWQIAEAQTSLGDCLAALKRYDDAEPLLLESYATIKRLRNESDWLTHRALAHLINLYRVWGKPEKAAQYKLSS